MCSETNSLVMKMHWLQLTTEAPTCDLLKTSAGKVIKVELMVDFQDDSTLDTTLRINNARSILQQHRHPQFNNIQHH
jgi:hypothetical protein